MRRFTTAVLLSLLVCAGAAAAQLPELLYDDFDDGDYAGWVVQDPYSGGASPLTAAIVASPEGYAVRGVGSGYSGSGEAAYLIHPLAATGIGELSLEMRAKSGTSRPSHACTMLWSGNDYYRVDDFGEDRDIVFRSHVQGQDYNHIYPGDNEWHDFKWSRDADGDWSLHIDGVLAEADFYRDSRLTSFDRVVLAVIRNQSEIEWVRVSGIPEPTTMLLLAAGATALVRRRRPRRR